MQLYPLNTIRYIAFYEVVGLLWKKPCLRRSEKI